MPLDRYLALPLMCWCTCANNDVLVNLTKQTTYHWIETASETRRRTWNCTPRPFLPLRPKDGMPARGKQLTMKPTDKPTRPDLSVVYQAGREASLDGAFFDTWFTRGEASIDTELTGQSLPSGSLKRGRLAWKESEVLLETRERPAGSDCRSTSCGFCGQSQLSPLVRAGRALKALDLALGHASWRGEAASPGPLAGKGSTPWCREKGATTGA